MRQESFIAYAMCAASYLVENITGIRSIILFGSVARGKFDRESDIDVFIDIPESTKQKEKEIKTVLSQFTETETFEKWRLKGVNAEISPIIGDLKSPEWESLYLSICSEGIWLYGKYEGGPKGLKHNIIFSYETIKAEKKRVYIYRKLFGYKIGKTEYRGMVSKCNGTKLGAGVFIVPVDGAQQIRRLFETERIPVKIYEAWL